MKTLREENSMKGKKVEFLVDLLLLMIAMWVLLWLIPLVVMEDDLIAKSPLLEEVRGETR
jgi:hypothetical protein